MSQSPNIYRGVEAVRRRPGMYIGGTDQRSLNGCVLELIANSIEDNLAGHGTLITVTIHDDGSLSVTDLGEGISIAPHPEYKIPSIEVALTALHISDEYQRKNLCGSRLSGLGITCVNAVSEWMQVNTVWEGNEYQIRFAQGRTTESLRQVTEPKLARGTVVRFKPDPEIFKVLTFDRNFLAFRLNTLAVLHPGLSLVFMDERQNPTNRSLVSLYHYPNGITDYLKVTCARATWPQPEPIVLNSDANGIKIALGFQFTETTNFSVLSFANSSPTSLGGVHVRGFFKGLAQALTILSKPDFVYQPNNLRTGLNAFVAVWLADPSYGGSVKEELINPEVETAIRELTVRGVTHWAAQYGEQANGLIQSLHAVRRAKANPDEN